MLRIFCVLNDLDLRPFSVTINPTNATVDEVKTAIRAASSPELDYWAAANLTLVRIFKEGEGGVKWVTVKTTTMAMIMFQSSVISQAPA
ncbi:hypothetical protein BJ741DRAFT_671369 [Chytriomyces cf. hyalinus JEL632]|nr:hypothetical protein BJ741DRAFT_671369 [Chytriomyces cf. hyalinus JEL632]